MIHNKTLRTLGLYPAGFSRSASGAAASFRTDLAAPLRDLTVGISPVQSGSGDPSLDNVRPISGWTGANINVCKENLVDLSNAPSTTTSHGITWTKHADGTVSASGINDGIGSYYYVGIDLPPGNYYFDAGINDGIEGTRDAIIWNSTLAERAKQWDGVTAIISAKSNKLYEFKVVEGYRYIFELRIANGIKVNNYVFTPGIYSSDGTTYSVSWQAEAGTVYGGTLDVTAGTLTVTHMARNEPRNITSITSESYRSSDHTTSFWFYDSPITTIIADDRPFSNMAVFTTSATPDSNINQFGVMTVYPHSWWMRFSAELVGTTIDSIYAYFVEHPFQICAPLDTPFTYQLTPVEIRTLFGRNNIWADTGDVALSYREGGIGSRSWMLALLAGRRNA